MVASSGSLCRTCSEPTRTASVISLGRRKDILFLAGMKKRKEEGEKTRERETTLI